MAFEFNEYLLWKIVPFVLILALALAILVALNASSFPQSLGAK